MTDVTPTRSTIGVSSAMVDTAIDLATVNHAILNGQEHDERLHRRQMVEDDDSGSSVSPDHDRDDEDEEERMSLMEQANDSQSSLGVSLQDMELDAEHVEEQHRLSPISRLPAELLISVFSRLSSPTDLRACLLTSKYWARNCVDLLWHKPATDTWRDVLNVIAVVGKRHPYFDYCSLIKRVNLAKVHAQVSDGTFQQLSSLRRVERLTLTDCHGISKAGLVPFIRGNPNLLAIDITGLEKIDDTVMHQIAQSCCKLQGLNITRCWQLTDQSLIEVAKNCRRIKRLKLNECSSITDAAVLTFADFCHDLVEIDLFKVSEITDASVTALVTKGRMLRELRLAYCDRITDDAFLRLPPNRLFESLRILDLTDCTELGDNGLQHIICAAPKLRNLVLAKCRQITDRGVMAITRLGKNLHYIHLGHCHRITDAGVNHLTRYCNRIRYIDLACCGMLTDDSVKQLASLPKLKRIGLVKCQNITDESILALAQPKPNGPSGTLYPNSLERLHLSYCLNLTIRGIRNMLNNCPRLNHLSLTGVPEFLRDDVLQFCRPAPIEFNEQQREVFCVFSGQGVSRLRRHLYDAYQTPPTSMATGTIAPTWQGTPTMQQALFHVLANSAQALPLPLHGPPQHNHQAQHPQPPPAQHFPQHPQQQQPQQQQQQQLWQPGHDHGPPLAFNAPGGISAANQAIHQALTGAVQTSPQNPAPQLGQPMEHLLDSPPGPIVHQPHLPHPLPNAPPPPPYALTAQHHPAHAGYLAAHQSATQTPQQLAHTQQYLHQLFNTQQAAIQAHALVGPQQHLHQEQDQHEHEDDGQQDETDMDESFSEA